jgi:hypothetical protein
MNEYPGYLNQRYIASLHFWGEPLWLEKAQAWLLKRSLPDSKKRPGYDLSGAYPFFRCLKPENLAISLAELESQSQALSLVLVSDPLTKAPELWPKIFPEICRPFKSHWGIDFSQPLSISKHHRYYARKAQQNLQIVQLASPQSFVAEWSQLYKHLIQKHTIKGIRQFSLESFHLQLGVPGLVAFAAYQADEIVAMQLWYWEPTNKVAYSHLSASSEKGYQLSASYGLYQSAIDWFQAQGVLDLDLGGETQSRNTGAKANGLGFFKQGWANIERPVWLCGKVYRPVDYDRLAGTLQTDYFPAYRKGENGPA